MYSYAFFHMNIMFSSISEARRSEVVERCYTPLLDLVEEEAFPLGLEATGYTLETIAHYNPAWIKRLAGLLARGCCEFIGSGYAQAIGPLFPAHVNAHNLRLGTKIYQALLGITPRLALVHEQAYAPGIVPLYLDAGYSGIIMEWENARQAHPEWPPHIQDTPQRVMGTEGKSIDLLWNHSLSFQQFQRVVHDEITLTEYLARIKAAYPTTNALCLYGNDAEIFNFRPGRFIAEPKLDSRCEWEAIRTVLAAVRALPKVTPTLPSCALAQAMPHVPHTLALESAAQPIVVKKQPKYNITRWGATGRDDIGANTLCRRLADCFAQNNADKSAWKELIYLCSSDFRTHIVPERWQAYRDRLLTLYGRHFMDDPLRPVHIDPPVRTAHRVPADERLIYLTSGQASLCLNRNRGLAINSLHFTQAGEAPLAGTLAHGYYQEITLGADFYSGHMTYELPGHSKITDLVPVVPHIAENAHSVTARATIPCAPLLLQKTLTLHKETPRVDVRYQFHGPILPGSLRLGYLTLTPTSFDARGLQYATHNGGTCPETHFMNGQDFDHGSPVSFLVSANCAVGMTEGIIEFGDVHKGLRISLHKDSATALCLVTHRQTADGFFARITFSLRELDDTSRTDAHENPILTSPCLGFSLTPYVR